MKDPVDGGLRQYTTRPESLHGIHGYRIQPSNGAGFFIANQGGTWRVMDRHHIEPELLINIGLALEHHPLREQTGTLKVDEEFHETDNQPNLNNGIGDEGLIDPNKP